MRWVLLPLALSVWAASAPGVARAHLGSTKLTWLTVGPREVSARVELDPVDVAYALSLDDADDARADDLTPRADAIRSWAARVFEVRAGGDRCAAEASEVSAVDVSGALRMTRAVRVALRFTCEGRPTLYRDHAVFDEDAQHEAIVRLGDRATVLRAGRQELALDAPEAGSTLWTFLVEGAWHLVTGYDHLLFLLSLLLVAGERARRDGTAAALRDVALVVTAFTIGHSVTLIAAALDVVTLPSRLVESAIGGSIVLAAAHNLARPDARAELRVVAGLFGLVHGFGFSSVLRELVLPAGERVVALLAFNVGVELAQLALVALVVPALAVAARSPRYRAVVVQGGSIAIAAVGLYWLVTRALDL